MLLSKSAPAAQLIAWLIVSQSVEVRLCCGANLQDVKVGHVLALAALVLASGCSGGSSSSAGSAESHDNSPIPQDAAVAACTATDRPDQPNIIVRQKAPTRPFSAQRLGGGHVYNRTSKQCQTAAASELATTGNQAGSCVQVALESENTTYPVDAIPAPPLNKVLASRGSC